MRARQSDLNWLTMHRLGIIIIWIGLALAVAGLIAGFGGIALGFQDAALYWLGLVPVGFALLLAGVVMTQLGRKN